MKKMTQEEFDAIERNDEGIGKFSNKHNKEIFYFW